MWKHAVSHWRYGAGALMVLAGIGYFYFGGGSNVGATLTITPGSFKEQVSVSGTVVAAQNVDLGFAASGRIAGVYARVGQYVAAGTILAEIENDDAAAALTQKRAARMQAEANLASLRAGTRPEEVAVASVAVENAKTALVSAIQSAYTASDDAVHNRIDTFFINPRTNPKISFNVSDAALKSSVERERMEVETVLTAWGKLAATVTPSTAAHAAKESQAYLTQLTAFLVDTNIVINQGIPDQTIPAATLSSYGTTLATARTNVNTGATTLAANISSYESAETTLTLKKAGPTAESIAAQEAAVAVAAAEVRSAEAKLVATRVAAPFSGTLTRMDVRVGEIVSPTSSEISMQSNGVFEIETFIPEVNIARIARGNAATTTLDAYGSSIVFPAAVIAVDPAETVREGVPTYKTTLAFLEADPRIRSGMTANVVIETGTLHDAVVIPSGAIGIKDGAPYVSVVQGDTIVSRAVVTGSSPALGQAHVLSGLSAGEVILLLPAP